ncbi:MAG TPA: threonine-phosphate decarboxylase CobD [Xanthobacteraceae bacterium]|jgi:cobalamin biosynthetic protein CobC|nr:threonine-phosphate decarboxylase CobD [Xanthobacteraceae bacterium]
MEFRTDLAAPLWHGGDLDAARRLFPAAPQPFIDLSTGINPFSYPLPRLAAETFTRLPEPAAIDRLAVVAAKAYGVPSADHVVAAPGGQILLPFVAALARPGRAAVLGPTYAEHARVAALAGHATQERSDIRALAKADLAIVVNPNNPDGRLIPRDALLALADALDPGLLVVDEAFMDVGPPGASVAGAGRRNIVVLRSFGKFYGLAGLRLGFALAAPELARHLRAALGPWAVSGPAIAIGELALADGAWNETTQVRLAATASRLDEVLSGAGLEVAGGTSLFRLVRTPAAPELFDRLGGAGIYVRRFAEQPTWLRVGLPASEPQWVRLAAALTGPA